MNNAFYQIQFALIGIKQSIPFVLCCIGVLWMIQIFNSLVGYRLNYFGIMPRNFLGLIGIVFCPFLHGSFSHLLFNSIPLFVLMNFILLKGFITFVTITCIIILLSGLAVWLLGRPAIHVGASGLIMGYFGFALVDAYENSSSISIGVAIVCLYYFAGFIFQILPTGDRTSWESHLFGLLAGILAVFLAPILTPYLIYLMQH